MTAPIHKIVVVEDDDHVRSLLQELLESVGHSVVATGDSVKAAELVRREAPDLVLCDVAMPGVDGYAVLKALKSEPATADTPVIFVTAHQGVGERVRAFKMGAVDYITAPFTRAALLGKVERILRAVARRGSSDTPPAASAADASPETHATVPSVPPTEPHMPAARPVRAPVDRDPKELPSGAGTLPPFSQLPEMVRTVLIADDNDDFRDFLGQVMSRHGFQVYPAGDGEEALRLLLDKRPWLILADVNMPLLDGFELCRRVRATSMISHRPFVFVSGWDDYRDRQRGLMLGADEFVSKQTPVRELLIRIHLLMQRYSDAGTFSPRKPVMEGSIEVVGAPGLLQMWHQGRLSGVCTVRAGTRVFEARFREGEIVAASSGEHAGAEAVYDVLGWPHGVFRFVPGPVEQGEPLADSFDHLLLEGCRLLDEERRAEGVEAARPEPPAS